MSANPAESPTGLQSLAEQIASFQANMLPTIPEDVMQTLVQAGRQVAALGIEQSALKTGDRCPEFSLQNARGDSVSRQQLLGGGPLVISFYRGAWCPYCNLEINALARNIDSIRREGADLVAISPQLPEKAERQVGELGLDFEVLSDVGNTLAKRFGLVFTLPEALRPIYSAWGVELSEYNGDEYYQLPVPATYIVDRDGFIRYHFVDSDYTRRLEPAVIIEQLQQL